MNPRRFDSLTRLLAPPKTRRGLLGSLAAVAAGLLGARATDAQVTQAQCGNVTCRNNPGKCNPGCVCCVYSNGNSRCRPPGTCSPGTVACPPGQVVGPSGGCVAPTTTTCPAGAGGLCGNPTSCSCGRCLARREGGVACGDTVLPNNIPCDECLTDADCAALYPSEPRVVCAYPGPECNCEGVTSTPGVCFRPCAG